MDVTQRNDLEREIRRRCDAEDLDGAVTVALRGYGPEVVEFLVALHRSEDDGREVFSRFSEELHRSIARFSWKSSFRTWAYAIARHASSCHRREARRLAARYAPLSDNPALAAVVEQVRTETISYLRTERRTRLVQLRDRLPPDEQQLLMLRVDRALAWNDLARVFSQDEAELDGEALRREAARLRKRFQLIKEKIYEMARCEGLVPRK